VAQHNLRYTKGFFLRCVLLVVPETRAASKMSVSFGAEIWNAFDSAWQACHKFATCLVTHVLKVSPTRFFTYFAHVCSSHGIRQVC